MPQFLEQKELFDRILLLQEDEVREPMEVFERFFSDYHLHECRYILWTMVETCLTTDNPEFSEPAERASLMMNYKNLQRLIEAGALMLERHLAAARPDGRQDARQEVRQDGRRGGERSGERAGDQKN
jgi:hypothetical protein